MNARSTWILLVIAAAVFGVVMLDRHFQSADPGAPKVIPGLKASAVTAIQILPGDQRSIRVERTNGFWHLTDPVAYPAQRFRVEQLLTAFEKLIATRVISGAELRARKSSAREFGFEPRQMVLVLEQGDEEYRILVGNRTAPGTEFFLQVVGAEDVYVLDAELLNMIPGHVSEWRDPTLLGLNPITFNRLVATNAGIVLDLRINPTNQTWRIVQPVNHRAEQETVAAALQRLHLLRAIEFDDSNPSLESLGLQPPELVLALRHDTNNVVVLEFGRTNSSGQVYARRAGQSTVVTVARELVEPWLAANTHYYRDYVDRQLVVLTSMPDTVEVRAQDTFTVARQTNGVWRLLPEGITADTTLVHHMIATLGTTRVEIEDEVVTEAGLPGYGLDNPSRQYVLITGDVTNEIHFGTNSGEKVFVRCKGETFVHSVKAEVVQALPAVSWELRDRRVWNFSENDVASLAFETAGRTNVLNRGGPGAWTPGPGHSGIVGEVERVALEEIAHELGQLHAISWLARGSSGAADGFIGNRLVVTLKDQSRLVIEFGNLGPSGSPSARTELAGEMWAFEFPWGLYFVIDRFLISPAAQP